VRGEGTNKNSWEQLKTAREWTIVIISTIITFIIIFDFII